MNLAPVAFSWNAWAIDGLLRGAPSPPFTKATVFSAAVWPTGVTAPGLYRSPTLIASVPIAFTWPVFASTSTSA